jgi:hypothetical protein
VLELQIGSRLCQARLDHLAGELPPVAIGSSVELTGTYSAQGYEAMPYIRARPSFARDGFRLREKSLKLRDGCTQSAA